MNTSAYISLSARIREKCPSVKDIDLFNKQYVKEEGRRNDPFNTPAVFIEYHDGQWEDMSPYKQEQQSGFYIHCVVSTSNTTRNIDQQAPLRQQTLLEHLLFDERVHRAINGFNPSGAQTTLRRTATSYDHDHDQLMVTIHFYPCVLKEQVLDESFSAVTVTQTSVAGGVAKLEIQVPEDDLDEEDI